MWDHSQLVAEFVATSFQQQEEKGQHNKYF